MSEVSELPCWEIMKCKSPEKCQAYQNPEIACWELVKVLGDYRSTFHVCQDCLVYLLKQEDCMLSEADMKTILANRGVCVLA